MRGVELVGARIDGEVHNLVLNGVDVAPLVEAKLDPALRRPGWRALQQHMSPHRAVNNVQKSKSPKRPRSSESDSARW